MPKGKRKTTARAVEFETKGDLRGQVTALRAEVDTIKAVEAARRQIQRERAENAEAAHDDLLTSFAGLVPYVYLAQDGQVVIVTSCDDAVNRLHLQPHIAESLRNQLSVALNTKRAEDVWLAQKRAKGVYQRTKAPQPDGLVNIEIVPHLQRETDTSKA